jgi:hypothetical protein
MSAEEAIAVALSRDADGPLLFEVIAFFTRIFDGGEADEEPWAPSRRADCDARWPNARLGNG